MNRRGLFCWAVIVITLVGGTVAGAYFSRPRDFGSVTFQSSSTSTIIETPYEWTNDWSNPSCLTGQAWCWHDFKHWGKA